MSAVIISAWVTAKMRNWASWGRRFLLALIARLFVDKLRRVSGS
jgi:hypothetical protein